MIEIKSLYPPTVISFPTGGRYAISGSNWVPVGDNVTLSDIKWIPSHRSKKRDLGFYKKEWKVAGSTGNEYDVKYQKGFGWHCSCPGHLYRRNCRHVDTLRAQHEKR